ncbi:MAG: lipoate--protein ligase family protein [bacterium]|nr:lipoate--protein ligase family protein [bacterium]
MRCRLIDYSLGNLAANMSLEEALFEAVVSGASEPVFRFWSNGPAVALGISQRVGDMVYPERCREDGIPLVRRFSGGGTVYHADGNLNFTLALPNAKCGMRNADFQVRLGIKASYDLICGTLADALASLGLEAGMGQISDVMVNGRKVSGNAQARRRGALLHHGTVLIDMDTLPVERYLKIPAGVHYTNHLDFVTTLRREGYSGGEEGLKQAILACFAERFKLDFHEDEPDRTELERSSVLLEERYSKPEWNERR